MVIDFYSSELAVKTYYLVLSFCLCLFVGFGASDAFYYIVTKPFLLIDASRSFLFTDLREGFQTTLYLIVLVAFLFTLPYALYLCWTFWKPSLYAHEISYKLTVFWIFWFLLCTSMTYTFFLPCLWRFFLDFELSSGLVNIHLEATIRAYFTFTFQIWMCVLVFLTLPFAFKSFGTSRQLLWFGSVLCIALLSPPDIMIQSAFTLGLWVLLEVAFLYNSVQSCYVPLVMKVP